MIKIWMALQTIFFVIITTGRSKQITEEDLIGGKWRATAGFKDEKAQGDPLCPDYDKGLEFMVKHRKKNLSII